MTVRELATGLGKGLVDLDEALSLEGADGRSQARNADIAPSDSNGRVPRVSLGPVAPMMHNRIPQKHNVARPSNSRKMALPEHKDVRDRANTAPP